MTRLSDFNTTRIYFQTGDIVRLRPVVTWAGNDPGARPIQCQYVEDGGGFRTIYWSAELDRCIERGQKFRIVHSPADSLPFACHVERYDGSGWHLHPDWLETVGSTPTDGEPECQCDSLKLANSGHEKGCLWPAWRRKMACTV